ncbi:MAG: DUF2079 domain-containing protein [Candidatus Eremiobacteraeota bacterium]|nr:DUF2079 domain-containing protein [Candidatus Eremiobacteraeota bacterium]
MNSRRTVIALSLIVAAILLVCAVVRTALWTYGADTGTLAIAIQNVPSGMFDQFEHASHFRFHWSPILAALYPLLAITRSILTLQIVQILLVVASVGVYYLLIERYIGKPLAVRCAIVALLYPPLIALAFDEFHELAFDPFLTFSALLALSNRKWVWYALTVALLLCVKEDVALLCGLFGGVLTVAGMRRNDRAYVTAGGLTVLGAAAVLIAYFGIIIPRVGGWGPSGFYTYPYNQGIGAVARQIFNTGRLTYVLEMLVPLAFLPLRTPWFWFVVPGLGIILLANSGDVWRMGMHYVALWIPWILLAMAAGVAQIREHAGERAALRWSSAAIALCVVFLIAFNPTHAEHYLRPEYSDIAAVRRVIKCVPPDATLGTHDEWYSAMAFLHPNETIGAPPYAKYLLFADDYPNAEFQTKIWPAVRREVASGQVDEICRVDRVAVYRRVGP